MAGKYFIGYSTIDVTDPGSVRYNDIEIVKRDLMNNFMTRKGERPMQPNYGSIVWELLFEPLDKTNRDLIVNDSKRIIANDPRVRLLDLVVQEYEHGYGLRFLLSFEPDAVQDTLFVAFKRQLVPGEVSDVTMVEE